MSKTYVKFSPKGKEMCTLIVLYLMKRKNDHKVQISFMHLCRLQNLALKRLQEDNLKKAMSNVEMHLENAQTKNQIITSPCHPPDKNDIQ